MLRRAATEGLPVVPDWTAIGWFERPTLTRHYGNLIQALWQNQEKE
jgi:hypothetical protein